MPIRKQKNAKKASTNSTARLEEKLDGLFSLLKSGAQPTVDPSVRPTTQPDAPAVAHAQSGVLSGAKSGVASVAEASAVSYQQTCSPVYRNDPSYGVSLASPDIVLPDPRTGRVPDIAYNKDALVNPPANFFQPKRSAPPSSASTAYYTPDDATSASPYPSADEAKTLLKIFENRMLRYFPFMRMPPYADSYDFRTEHPFLFLCIMAVASRSTEQQGILGKEIRSILARKMLVESERSLDLLFGILVYSGWSVIPLYFCLHAGLIFKLDFVLKRNTSLFSYCSNYRDVTVLNLAPTLLSSSRHTAVLLLLGY